MTLLLFLIFSPLAVALLCLLSPGGMVRGTVVKLGSLLVAAASVMAA